MSNSIEGRVTVITGASSGLGAATARHLTARGATVVLGARRLERIETLAGELERAGGKAFAVTTDVTDRAQVKALVDAAVQRFGRVDVMLNNAGLMQQSALERLKVDEWDNMIDINIKGVLYGIAAVLPHMQKQKAGHMIFVSSVAGHKVTPAGTIYSATKHAVRAIAEGFRQEVKPYPHDHYLAWRGGDRIAEPYYRPAVGGGHTAILRKLCHPCGLLRARGRVRNRAA